MPNDLHVQDPATTDTPERTGRAASGDVSLFYRHFGRPTGRAPILIHHGAQYYDSADWIDVARRLAEDREVVAFDTRGYANSSWSPSKDYSIDAAIGDCLALLDHFGWTKAVLLGHSRGGGICILLAAHVPERCAGLIVVDRPLHLPLGERARDGKKVGRPHKVYRTIEDALADLSRSTDVPPGSRGRARLHEFLKPVEGGFAITGRDPDRGNTVPTDRPDFVTKYHHENLWPALSKVVAPTIIIRGTRSDRYPPAALEKLAGDYPHVQRVDVESGHDVVAGAADDLVRHTLRFVRERVDMSG
jgi:pimeloyl-ACP methyl ester carboxylesterase